MQPFRLFLEIIHPPSYRGFCRDAFLHTLNGEHLSFTNRHIKLVVISVKLGYQNRFRTSLCFRGLSRPKMKYLYLTSVICKGGCKNLKSTFCRLNKYLRRRPDYPFNIRTRRISECPPKILRRMIISFLPM